MSRNMMNMGVSSTLAGSICVTRNAITTPRLPLKR